MPRGVYTRSQKQDKQEQETVTINTGSTKIIDSKIEIEEPKKEAEEFFHYNESTKSKLIDLVEGQAWFRDNDGNMYIGQSNRNEIFVEKLGHWVNRIRVGDFVRHGSWIKEN